MVSSNTGFLWHKETKEQRKSRKKGMQETHFGCDHDGQRMITFIPQVCLFLSARQPKSAGTKSYQCVVGKTRGRIA